MLGCAGNEIIQTPHIDQLAERGVRFNQAYSTTPICVAARASIMTGIQSHNMGFTHNIFGANLPVEETLPQQLSDAGYQTKVIGKMHVYPERCHYGFDDMILCEEGRQLGVHKGEHRGYGDYEEWLSEQGYPGLAHGHGLSINEYSVTPWHLPDHLHPTEWIGHRACKEIKRRDWTRPMFLWASFTAPHPPLTPLLRDLYMYENDEIEQPYIGDWTNELPVYHQQNISRYNKGMSVKQTAMAKRAYMALVTQVDRQINRIIGTLAEQNMLNNTWFIFTSDHGESMGDHYLWQKSNYLQGSCKIPFIITPPLQGEYFNQELDSDWLPGTVNNSVVGLQDILPTITDIASASTPKNIDGISLVPIVQDSSKSVREDIFGEYGIKGERTFLLTNGEWKYIWYEEDGCELLFNIKDDKNELTNLAKKELNIRKTWESKLLGILNNRENDPAVEDNKLKPKAQGGSISNKELTRRLNKYMIHKTPMGLH
jgi:arylsulfatase A-like enzyme